MIDIPKMALTVWQPWAWLIVHGWKDIENRDWRTHYRGPVAIHAGQTLDDDCDFDVRMGIHPVTQGPLSVTRTDGDWQRGGIVGVAEIVDCVERSDSPWFVGRYGFVLRNAQPVPFIPVKGKQGFFDWRARLAA